MTQAHPNGMIVRIAGVHKYFRRGSERLDVLNDLTLEVPEGEFLVLMGPSGSGKTTLLNLIAGLDQPSAGEVWVGDQRISAMTESQLARWRTRHLGFVFQFYHLLPVLTAYENVELPLLLLPLSAAQRRRQVLTALELVGLSDRMKHRPGQLSGGQQQRVGIARAIVTDPTLIVADEPTGDLDARSAEEILDLLSELCRSLRKTVLVVTHDAAGRGPRRPRAAPRQGAVDRRRSGRVVQLFTQRAAGMKYLLLIAEERRPPSIADRAHLAGDRWCWCAWSRWCGRCWRFSTGCPRRRAATSRRS